MTAASPARDLSEDRARSAPDLVEPVFSVVTEADDYTRSVRSIDIQVVRAGPGHAPTEIRSAMGEDWVGTSLRVGFPVFSRTTLAEDVVAVGTIVTAPPGARWCGIDLEDGDVFVYGPGAEHVAVNPEGMRFAFAVISTDDLDRAAADLELDVGVPAGSVRRMTSSAATELVRDTLSSRIGDPAALDVTPTVCEPGLLDAVVHMVASTAPSQQVPTQRKIDDRRIVLACVDYAESVQRIPALRELCEAAFVSERRLRQAFVTTHDMPPHQFFLTWGLDVARRRLLSADPRTETVSRIAATSGFTHLGRFARYYKRQFGESPSATLCWTPQSAHLL